MEQIINKVYEPLFTQKPRYFILMGWRGAGRSTVASQLANAKLAAPEYFRCAIMRYILWDIRNSIYLEILDRAEENGVREALQVNDSMMSIDYWANSINAVGFRKSSGDQKSKLKSLANYNYVIIEEADEIPEADFMQLDDSLRTIKWDITIILLLNAPPKSHWIIKRWFNLLDSEAPNFYIPELKPECAKDTIFIRTSYEDNRKNLDARTVEKYEEYKNTKPDHYWNMIKGYIPETVRGKIYKNWQEIEEVPHEARIVRRGLDFWWFPDPLALVDVYKYNGWFILDEQLYKNYMGNATVAEYINALPEPNTIVIWDSAEPKSIAEIKSHNVNILPSEKWADSVEFWIKMMNEQKISFTKRSKNLKYEYENYAWKEDKSWEPTWETTWPEHLLMAANYAVRSILSKPESTFDSKKFLQRERSKKNIFSDIWL